MSAFSSVFTPRGVAVCGDFQSQRNLGYRVLENLLRGEYRGVVQPVSNTGESVMGKPIVNSLASVAPEISLIALAGVPYRSVPALLKSWKPRAAERVIVWLGDGPEPASQHARKKRGEPAEPLEACIEQARLLGACLIGPQSGGIINTSLGLHLWSVRPLTVRPGGIGVVGQGAAIVSATLEEIGRHGLGISQVVDLGQACGVSCESALAHFAEDEKTELVILLAKSVRDGAAFMKAALALAMRKPVVALLPAPPAARDETCSHQGVRLRAPASCSETALASRALGIAALQSGIVPTADLESLGDAANVLLRSSHFPPMSGGPLLVLSPGGLEEHMTAQLLKYRLPAPALSKKTIDRLGKRVTVRPGAIIVEQSLQSEELQELLETVLKEEGVSGVILACPSGGWESLGNLLATVRASCGKPIVVYAPHGRTAEQSEQQAASAVPMFPCPERAVRGFFLLREHANLLEILRRKGFAGDAPAEPTAGEDTRNLSERCQLSPRAGTQAGVARAAALARRSSSLPLPSHALPGCICSPWAAKLFEKNSIRVAARACVPDAKAAKAFAARAVFPLSLRIIPRNASPTCCSPIGDLAGTEYSSSQRDLARRVGRLWATLRTAQILISEAAETVFPGCIRGWRDRTFGPIIELWTERFPVQARICPVGRTDAEAMLTSVLEAGSTLRASAAMASLMEFVCKLACLFRTSPDVAGLEITRFGIAHKQALVLEGRMWRMPARA